MVNDSNNHTHQQMTITSVTDQKLLDKKKDRKYRLFLYSFSFLTISLSSGIVYGFPHLRNNLLLNGSTLSESKLGIVYTVGSWSVHGGRFFSGIARDTFGTKLVTVCCLISSSLGCLGLAFANESDTLTLSLSFFLVGLGSGAQLCLQPVVSLFHPKWQGTLLASLSGAFQISGLVFLVLVHITTNRNWSFGYLALLLFILALGSVHMLPKHHFVQFHQLKEQKQETGGESNLPPPHLLMVPESNIAEFKVLDDVSNKDNFKQEQEELDEERRSIVGSIYKDSTKNNDIDDSNDSVSNKIQGVENKSLVEIEAKTTHVEENGVENNNDNHNPTTSIKLIKSKEYMLLLIWFSLVLIPMQYYIGTIAFQLERKGDDEGTYINFFSICYALAALAAPVMGKIADLAGVGVSQLIATIFVSLSLIILSFPYSNNMIIISSSSQKSSSADTIWSIQIIGLLCYGIGRMSIFGMYFTNIGKRFGYTHYGTMVGFGLLISAIFSLLQYILIYIADVQQGNEFYVNLISGIVLLLYGVPYCIWLSVKERRERMNKIEEKRVINE